VNGVTETCFVAELDDIYYKRDLDWRDTNIDERLGTFRSGYTIPGILTN